LPVSPKRKAAILHYLKCWRLLIFDNEFLTLLLRIPKKSSNFRIISFYSAIPRDVMEHGTRANVIRNALYDKSGQCHLLSYIWRSQVTFHHLCDAFQIKNLGCSSFEVGNLVISNNHPHANVTLLWTVLQ